ncbi:hypothetical protein NAH03_24260, partial [Stenotrophomonas maltophilia]|uniref:hypothetical protein n=1 Tax=Stenotrophomonas maltophilia TaxID=40324 RepID=UPI00225AACAD|nr:hypothetical protein [Stenotrophomonas maltophilia]
MENLDVITIGEAMAMFVATETGDLAEVEHFMLRFSFAVFFLFFFFSLLSFYLVWLFPFFYFSFPFFLFLSLLFFSLLLYAVPFSNLFASVFLITSFFV